MLSACITELVVVFLAPVEIRVKNYSKRVYGFIVSRQHCFFESVLILLELGYFTKYYENGCAGSVFLFNCDQIHFCGGQMSNIQMSCHFKQL